MQYNTLAEAIREHSEAVVHKKGEYARELRRAFYGAHPADQAHILANMRKQHGKLLWKELSQEQKLQVFRELSQAKKPYYFSQMTRKTQRYVLDTMPADEVADFLEIISHNKRQTYLQLLPNQQRDLVASLLTYPAETAGAVMTTNVVTLSHSDTVSQATQSIQQLQPDRTFHRTVYVVNDAGTLKGYLYLEDLVLHPPETAIADIMRPITFTVQVDQEQEEIARYMSHYNLTNVPVIDDAHRFLGVISAATLIDILEEESSEDIYRMASMQPVRASYFETSTSRMVYQRSSILVILLLAQSISVMIMDHYEALLGGLYIFNTLIASTGGNTSSQTSAIVIEGLTSGELHEQNKWRFLGREFWIASIIAVIMAVVGFARAYVVKGFFWTSLAVGVSLGSIVMTSVILGSFIPFALQRFNMDPAHYAGPLLATLMDIVGIYLFCSISQAILGA